MRFFETTKKVEDFLGQSLELSYGNVIHINNDRTVLMEMYWPNKDGVFKHILYRMDHEGRRSDFIIDDRGVYKEVVKPVVGFYERER